MDFTFNTYIQLLQTLQSQGYAFTTLADYIKSKARSSSEAEKSTPDGVEFPPPLGGAGGGAEDASKPPPAKSNPKSETCLAGRQVANPKLIILRHDVEARYQNARQFALIQHQMGIRGSYYFRLYKKPRNTRIIRNIVDLGHEIGYHYDDLSFCKGDHNQAIIRFEQHLDFLRTMAPVETITMEGAPLSSHDNRNLWEKYDYKAFGIIAEPYFDLNFGSEFNPTRNPEPDTSTSSVAGTRNPEPGTSTSSVAGTRNPEPDTSTSSVAGTPNAQPQTSNPFFYLTDTGRRWDGWRVSLRDKVPQQDEWIKQGLVYRSTKHIIKAAEQNRLPDKIMITFHPQRWNNSLVPWTTELIFQNLKNQVKSLLVLMRE
jgi:hypothetical protein